MSINVASLSIRSDRKYFNLRPFAAHHQDFQEKEFLRPPHVIPRNKINLERQNHSAPAIMASSFFWKDGNTRSYWRQF